jgi:hypothetical protein
MEGVQGSSRLRRAESQRQHSAALTWKLFHDWIVQHPLRWHGILLRGQSHSAFSYIVLPSCQSCSVGPRGCTVQSRLFCMVVILTFFLSGSVHVRCLRPARAKRRMLFAVHLVYTDAGFSASMHLVMNGHYIHSWNGTYHDPVRYEITNEVMSSNYTFGFNFP